MSDIRRFIFIVESNEQPVEDEQRFIADNDKEDDRLLAAYIKKNKINHWDVASVEEWNKLRDNARNTQHLYRIPKTDRAYLYHGTAKARLSQIAYQGLAPQETSRWSKDGYGLHSIGRVFLTDTVSTAEFYASQASKSRPVILRVLRSAIKDIKPDTRETVGSYFVERVISPEKIEWWNGKMWASI